MSRGVKYTIKLREIVQDLRRRGYLFLEIRKAIKLDVPKATLSNWLRDIKVNKKYQRRFVKAILDSRKRAWEASLNSRKLKHEIFLENLKTKNLFLKKKLSVDVQKIALAMLYLGEGAKWQGHRGLMLGSSDPIILKLYLIFLKNCYAVSRDTIKARISYRVDQNLREIEDFWSRELKIPVKNFYKTKPDLRTIGKKTKNKD